MHESHGVGRFVDARLRPAGKLAGEVARRDSGDLRPVATPGLQLITAADL